jgi:hypothetical protein
MNSGPILATINQNHLISFDNAYTSRSLGVCLNYPNISDDGPSKKERKHKEDHYVADNFELRTLFPFVMTKWTISFFLVWMVFIIFV